MDKQQIRLNLKKSDIEFLVRMSELTKSNMSSVIRAILDYTRDQLIVRRITSDDISHYITSRQE